MKICYWFIFVALMGGVDTPTPVTRTLQTTLNGEHYLIEVTLSGKDRNCEPEVVTWGNGFNIRYNNCNR